MVSLHRFYRILDKKRSKRELVNLHIVLPDCVIVGDDHAAVGGMLIIEGKTPVQVLTAQIILTGETQCLQYSPGPNRAGKLSDRILLRDSQNHLFMQQDLDLPAPAKELRMPFNFQLPKDSPSSFRIANMATQYKVIANLKLNAHPREMSNEKVFQVIRQVPRISESDAFFKASPRLSSLSFNSLSFNLCQTLPTPAD